MDLNILADDGVKAFIYVDLGLLRSVDIPVKNLPSEGSTLSS